LTVPYIHEYFYYKNSIFHVCHSSRARRRAYPGTVKNTGSI
jgi:hypothetical protein